MQPDSFSGWQQLGNEIHVWQASLDRDESARVRLAATLSPDERDRAQRFHFERDRNRFVVARGLLRELIGKYLQQDPAAIEFSYGPHGKPALSGPGGSNGFSFNLAHSADLVLYAFAKNRTLGIDVERINPESAGENIAQRYFSAREVSDLRTLPPEARVRAFFDGWTRKEAYLKALGSGLQTRLDSFSVSLAPGEAAGFLAGVAPLWRLAALHPAEGYAAAIVYDGGPSSIQTFAANSSKGENARPR